MGQYRAAAIVREVIQDGTREHRDASPKSSGARRVPLLEGTGPNQARQTPAQLLPLEDLGVVVEISSPAVTS